MKRKQLNDPPTGAQLGFARLATAFAVFSIGALSMGAVAIGALAIRRLALGTGRIRRLSIDELEVGRLRVRERVTEMGNREQATDS
jgi:hypothetical protein